MDKQDKRRKHNAFKAEALRLARESRSTQAAARALNIDPKRIYQWQREALAPLPAGLADAQRSVADYFDYYNHERLHSGIDYQPPYHNHQ